MLKRDGGTWIEEVLICVHSQVAKSKCNRNGIELGWFGSICVLGGNKTKVAAAASGPMGVPGDGIIPYHLPSGSRGGPDLDPELAVPDLGR
jgi:hypothetical protein